MLSFSSKDNGSIQNEWFNNVNSKMAQVGMLMHTIFFIKRKDREFCLGTNRNAGIHHKVVYKWRGVMLF